MAHSTRTGRLSRESGATMVEYLCVLTILNVALIPIISQVGTSSQQTFQTAASHMGGGSQSTIVGQDCDQSLEGCPTDPAALPQD